MATDQRKKQQVRQHVPRAEQFIATRRAEEKGDDTLRACSVQGSQSSPRFLSWLHICSPRPMTPEQAFSLLVTPGRVIGLLSTEMSKS